MPRIPSAERQVRTAPLADASLTPVANAGALGANLGQSLQQVSQDVQQIKDRQTQEANQTWGTEQATIAGQAMNDLQTQAEAARGKDALGIHEPIKKQFDQTFDAIEQSANNPQQRQFAAQLRQRNWESLDGQVQKHVAQENERYQDQTTESYIANQVETAARYDAATIDGNMEVERRVSNAMGAIYQQGERKGWDNETQIQARAKVATAIRATAAENLINNGSYIDAKAYLEKVGPSLNVNARQSLEGALKVKEAKVDSIAIADKIFTGSDNGATIDDLYQAAANDPAVLKNPDLLTQVEARLSMRQRALAQSYDEESARIYNQSYATAQADGFDAIPVTDLERLARIDPQRHAALVALEVKKAKGIPITTNWERYNTLRDLASVPQAVDPKTGKTFLQMNLADEFPDLAPAEREKLIDLRAGAVKELTKPDSSEQLRTVRDVNSVTQQTLGPLVKSLTIKKDNPDNALIIGFKQALETRVLNRQQATGKQLTRDEVQKEADNLMLDAAYKKKAGWFLNMFRTTGGGSGDIIVEGKRRNLANPAYVNQVYTVEQIPEDKINALRAELRTARPEFFIESVNPVENAAREATINAKLVDGFNAWQARQSQASP